jgi:hypothetical protein
MLYAYAYTYSVFGHGAGFATDAEERAAAGRMARWLSPVLSENAVVDSIEGAIQMGLDRSMQRVDVKTTVAQSVFVIRHVAQILHHSPAILRALSALDQLLAASVAVPAVTKKEVTAVAAMRHKCYFFAVWVYGSSDVALMALGEAVRLCFFAVLLVVAMVFVGLLTLWILFVCVCTHACSVGSHRQVTAVWHDRMSRLDWQPDTPPK